MSIYARLLFVAALLNAAVACRHEDDEPNDASVQPDANSPDDGGATLDQRGIGNAFNVTGATSTGHQRLTVTFSAPPNALEIANLANYSVDGLTLTGQPVLSGNTVTLATGPQTATLYTITITSVTRASDGAALTEQSADFTGRAAFNVIGASSVNGVAVAVTFDAAPNVAQARSLTNYAVTGLVLSGTPVLDGNTVTIATSLQDATIYPVVVAGVTRQSDGEPLLDGDDTFTGIVVAPPTVNGVTVTATNPDNGTIAYNTGSTTVAITGASFATVVCPMGVKLADRDGDNQLVGTTATTCKVDSDTQITATFPAGVRTNGATGWPITVTNPAGSVNSATPFVPKAGLVISEVFVGKGGATDHEYVELYNPTGRAIDPAEIELRLHTRTASGTDTHKPLGAITTAAIPSRGFYLLASSVSAADDVWFTHIDATYSASSGGLVGNGGAYISLSSAKDARVIDKVGWGNQLAPGFEGTAMANLLSDQSAERKPGLGVGHATDSDDNAADFLAPTSALSPRGTSDPIQPGDTFNVVSAVSAAGVAVVITFDAIPDATQATTLANYAIAGLTLSGTPTLNGNSVTITTTAQAAMPYLVTVSNVTRAGDGRPLDTNMAQLDGVVFVPPTITSLAIVGTSPDNGATPYNTGTTTVTITGTEFGTVPCPSGVTLDDLDGLGNAVNTAATSCTVDSATQITATFPPGVRTNGATGWAVRVANDAGSVASTQRFVPVAGLVISEVYIGKSGATDHEFVELYNPTQQPIDTATLGLHLHTRSGSGANTHKPLTAITSGAIGAKGSYLIASSVSDGNDAWTAHADATYSASSGALVGNGGVYLSLSATADQRVLDKVGWGTQPAGGFEGTALANLASDQSVERRPALSVGHNVDSDDNSADFLSASTTITPRGSADGIEPLPTFNATSAVSVFGAAVTITFDAPPDPVAATTLANYAGDNGLTFVGTPDLVGNSVTIDTLPQAAQAYTIAISNVTRGGDGRALDTSNVGFAGVALTAPALTSLIVASTNPDNGTTAYNTGTTTVTITGTMLDTVACPSGVRLADLDGAGNVVNTVATSCTVSSSTQITATFPAGVRTNGVVGWPVTVTNLAGSTNTVQTFVPEAGLVVSEVYLGSGGATDHEFVELYNRTAQPIDAAALGLRLHTRGGTGTDAHKPLTAVTATAIPSHGFYLMASAVSAAGDAWFDKIDATYSTSAGSLVANGGVYVSLSATADQRVLDKVGWGTQPANGFEGTVIATSPANDQSIERKPALAVGHATDSDNNAADFGPASTGITPRGTIDPAEPAATFDVVSATSQAGARVVIEFSAPPDPIAATTLANYLIAGLTLSGTPTLSGNRVTINTSPQSATTYLVEVASVTRAGDGLAMTDKDADLVGIALQAPTVDAITITATSPDNGTTPYNTGTTTVTITGTFFDTVTCPNGVKLDDLDGAGVAAGTTATSCTVDGSTQITAVFPSGIRTNGAAGWPVRVTNLAGDGTSASGFVPKAGLLLSEVCLGTTAGADREFVELYNATAQPIDPIALGVRLHVRSGAVTPTDTNKTLTAITAAPIPSHGFYLMSSAASTATEAWFTVRDATFADGIVGNGGVYVSLSATANVRVLDKLGWGTQATNGFEGAAIANLTSNNSVERLPAGGAGHATDTDDNSSDFAVQSTTLTPRGTASPAQP